MYTGYILLFKRLLYRRDFCDNCADKITLNVVLEMTMILCIFFCITDCRKIKRTNLGWLLREKYSDRSSSKILSCIC
jgi:hypothetical protein